ncbi:hypothetical protein ElyMa_003294100 [Elysia marginata]|uniref:C2H2-type domain-containing protein n=1 Tax=Elysia marginata TaxID=1093978 RepID=A0AAV4JB70_9GAST|nr:hypothetical protein ElyMa_003294100 [Elysia marginata]
MEVEQLYWSGFGDRRPNEGSDLKTFHIDPVPSDYMRRGCAQVDYLDLGLSRMKELEYQGDSCVDCGHMFSLTAEEHQDTSPHEPAQTPWTMLHHGDFKNYQNIRRCSSLPNLECSSDLANPQACLPFGDSVDSKMEEFLSSELNQLDPRTVCEIVDDVRSSFNHARDVEDCGHLNEAQKYSDASFLALMVSQLEEHCVHLTSIKEDDENEIDETDSSTVDTKLKFQMNNSAVNNNTRKEIQAAAENIEPSVPCALSTSSEQDCGGRNEHRDTEIFPDFGDCPTKLEQNHFIARDVEDSFESTDGLEKQGSVWISQNNGRNSILTHPFSDEIIKTEESSTSPKTTAPKHEIYNFAKTNDEDTKHDLSCNEETNLPSEKALTQRQESCFIHEQREMHRECDVLTKQCNAERREKAKEDETNRSDLFSKSNRKEDLSSTQDVYLGGMAQEHIWKEPKETEIRHLGSPVDGKRYLFHLKDESHKLSEELNSLNSFVELNTSLPLIKSDESDEISAGANPLENIKACILPEAVVQTTEDREETEPAKVAKSTFLYARISHSDTYINTEKGIDHTHETPVDAEENHPKENKSEGIGDLVPFDPGEGERCTEVVLNRGIRKILPRKPITKNDATSVRLEIPQKLSRKEPEIMINDGKAINQAKGDSTYQIEISDFTGTGDLGDLVLSQQCHDQTEDYVTVNRDTVKHQERGDHIRLRKPLAANWDPDRIKQFRICLENIPNFQVRIEKKSFEFFFLLQTINILLTLFEIKIINRNKI